MRYFIDLHFSVRKVGGHGIVSLRSSTRSSVTHFADATTQVATLKIKFIGIILNRKCEKTWSFAHWAHQGLPMSQRKGNYTLLTPVFTSHCLIHSNQVYLDCLELLIGQEMWSCPLDRHSLGGSSQDLVCCCSYIPWTCHNSLVVNLSWVVDVVAQFLVHRASVVCFYELIYGCIYQF